MGHIILVVGTNTLGTYSEAEEYFNVSMSYDIWCALSVPVKKRSLVAAFNAMSLMPWDGERTVSTQLAPFPRIGLTDIEGSEIASDSVPTIAKYGQFELAAYLATNKGFVDKSKGQVKKVGAGSAKVEFFESTIQEKQSTDYPQVIEQFFSVLSSTSSSVTVGEASGTCQESFFQSTEYGTH